MIRRPAVLVVSAWLVVAGIAFPTAGHAGLGDKIKKKVQDKAAAKVDELGEDAPAVPDVAEGAADDAPDAAGGGAAPAKVSDVSTKFDYVPGDKVLLADDFTGDELGEFPAQWRLVQGTFEVAEMDHERWLRCTSSDGRIRMKLPTMASFPEFWTFELDLFGREPIQSALTVSGLAEGDHVVWEMTFPHGNDVVFRSGDIFSATPVSGPLEGRHRVMFMARGSALKAYLDCQRTANVPEVAQAPGPVVTLEIRLWASSQPMITDVRFAEGCRPPKDMLAEGKLVTHGIHFRSGSDEVLPDSAPVLRQVAAYLEANAAVKLSITGHTDSQGDPAGNLDLSRRRAAAVAQVLEKEFGVAAGRLTTDGKGDTEAMAGNDTPAGRAMNRRVEFAKV